MLKRLLNDVQELQKEEIARLEKDYIDIFSGSKAVIIENKTREKPKYEDNQISRYQQKLIDRSYTKENIKLVYLNLYGSEVPAEKEEDETNKQSSFPTKSIL